MNIHLDRPDDRLTVKLNTILECFGLLQHISSPTHRAGHILDVMITKEDLSSSVEIVVYPPDISDHSLVIAKLPHTKPQPSVFGATVRAWKNFDRDAFRRDLAASSLCLSTEDWSSISPDDMLDMYQDVMRKLVDKYAPCRTVRKKYRPLTPWFNDACKAQKRKARCLERVYRRSKSALDRDAWLAQLRSTQDFYKQVQDVYWQTVVSESSGNAKKLWNSLSSLMGRKRRTAVQDGLSADEFLKCFADKVKDVRSTTSGSAPPNFSKFEGVPLTQFVALDLDDVRKLIKPTPNKSCGLDPIPTWLVKEFSEQIAPFVTVLLNKSILNGYFPLVFRTAEITPILKKNSLDPSVLTNYRPISNLSYLSKLLERAIKCQLLDHLDGNGLLPETQSAYRACHSTESALLKVSSDALLAADNGMVTLLGMLDLSAAFDCVDHQIFLKRLKVSYGIDGTTLAWIGSYFENRTQRVRYNGSISDTIRVESGVPQGSVLRPVFSLLFSSDVFDIALQHGFYIHGYADDLQVYQHCLPSDMNTLNLRFIDCMEKIQSWMSSNRLRLNTSKTEVIWLGSSRRLANLSPPPMVLGGHTILLSSSVRSLGVVIDSAVTFSSHVSRLVSSCYYQLRQLRSIRKSLTVDSCHALVRALILSRMDYCNGLLSGISKTLLGQLDGVLRASARLILQRQRTDHITTAMREQLHWLDASARIKYKLCVFAFRCINDLAPRYLARLCTPVASLSGRAGLRSAVSGDLLVPKHKTATIGPRAFAISCPMAWNSLSPELRQPGMSLPI